MVTFEAMSEVPQRDEVLTGVNRLLGFFLQLFMDSYYLRHSKENGFAGRDSRHGLHEV